VDQQIGVWLGCHPFAQLVSADGSVYVALTHPDVHIGATGNASYVCAQELVRKE
jgi:hypothetical protein